ncbi:MULTISPECIES: hypothetical protein [unclassified Streptomyces]|uniref:hypothetical protein n=1 Tax=unclassified Streptomyces TaxID=2593676 RepID=UPI00081D4A3A|nr:hypothetical protein [Streptomyces sp. ScaeMP-e83]MYR93382.1 hypothetical protein [Streptomyces sp. SID4937]SCD51633.1 hypothetical protein GA0115243_102542 [Streptomyces sp. ScaeMP-e83]
MNSPPVPLPAEHIPPGTAAWQTPDAQRWLAAVPARWAHPLWAVLALLVPMVWYIAASPLTPCTSAQPCGTDWPGIGMAVVLVLTPYWVWRQPRLALVGLAAGLVGYAGDGGFTESFGEPYALAYPLAAAFTTAGIVHRLTLAGRQRALALEAAGPVEQPLPAAARTFRRGRFSFGLAALMLAVAGFGYWQAQQVADAYEERAARATQLTGRVVAQEQDDDGDDILKVEADERTHRFETAVPEDFPVGSRVDIVVDGDWAALVAEPYDAFGWEALVVGGTAAALAFFANGVDGRTRSARLRRRPLPVLRVLVREDHEDGRTWVFAADDPEALRPILHFHSLHAFEDEDEEADGDGDDADAVDITKVRQILSGDDPPPPLREAVLYGAPYAGAEVALAARLDADEPEVLVECSVTAVKPATPGPVKRGPRRPERKNAQRPVEEIVAAMTPGTGLRVWKAHGFSRAVGLGLLVVQGGGIWAMVDDGPSWHWLWLPLALPWLISAVATALTWRITADRDGLWVTGAWRVRRVAWDAVTAVRHSEDTIRVGTGKDHPNVELSPTGWAWLERRVGREPYAVRAAEEVRALVLRPELRPAEEAPTARQGMPVGPPLVAVSLLWGAAVLLL